MQSLDLLQSAFAYVKPKIVILAPDGSQLWIPVELPANTGGSSPLELWPAGFKISIQLGDIPPKSPKVFTSAPGFFASNSWDLLHAWFITPSKTIAKP